MKVYFINLDRSRERLDWFRRQTADMDIDLVRVPAIDAKELSGAEIERLRSLSSGRNSLSAGELGCFLSHRKIWKKVVEDNAPWAFIAEDDIHFSRDAGNFLRSDDWIPAGIDMIKAETALKRVELGAEVLSKPFGHELRRLISYHLCSGGYFLTPGAAAHLLAYSDKHCEPVDEVLFSPKYGVLKHLSCLQLSPAICIQDAHLQERSGKGMLQSVIEHERVATRKHAREKRLTARLLREARRLGRQGANLIREMYLRGTRRAVFRKVSFLG